MMSMKSLTEREEPTTTKNNQAAKSYREKRKTDSTSPKTKGKGHQPGQGPPDNQQQKQGSTAHSPGTSSNHRIKQNNKLKHQQYNNQHPTSRDQETKPPKPTSVKETLTIRSQSTPVGLKIVRGNLHLSHKSLFAGLSATFWKLVILSLTSLHMR